ncbi:MAG: HEAT repeat domain-containing protein, partial [Terriglobales bacterium]
AVAALGQVLAADPFYDVRVVAAGSLGRLGGSAAEQALLTGLAQPDSRVRTAVVTALGSFPDARVFAALRRALTADPSYAVQAAAARALGQAKAPGAYELLAAAIRSHPSRFVLPGLMAGLAATGDPRAQAVLEHLAATSTGRVRYMALRLLHRPIPRPR